MNTWNFPNSDCTLDSRSFDEAYQSLLMIFSGDRRQIREGIAMNSWTYCRSVFQQVKGHRVNYLMHHPRLTPFHNSIRSTPPWNLRKRTRIIRPHVSYVGNRIRIPSLQIADWKPRNPIVSGVSETKPYFDIGGGNLELRNTPVPPVYDRLYPGVFPSPAQMRLTPFRGMFNIMERIGF